MEVTLYLPYYDYNDGAFDVSNDYYGENEYSKLVEEEYNKNKDIVYNSMVDAKEGSRALFEGVDRQTYKFAQKTPQSEEKVAYSSCNGTLYNSDGEKETVDGLISKYAQQKQFVEMVELDMDSSEEEFETELSIWLREHVKINEYKDNLGDEWTWGKEPSRNVKVHFKNNASQDVYAVLEGCKIMDVVDNGIFILFIENITLVDGI